MADIERWNFPISYWESLGRQLLEAGRIGAARPIQIDQPGQTDPHVYLSHIRKARRELIDAMAVADKHGETDLHRRFGFEVLNLDDLKAIVEERSAE